MTDPRLQDRGSPGFPRPARYVLLAVLLPTLGFCTMYGVTPVLAGAHDGGFLGMTLGLFLAQVVFGYVMVPTYRALSAVLVFTAASLLTWGSVAALLVNTPVFGPPGDPYGILADQRRLALVFFGIYVLVSIVLWEIAYRWTRPAG